MARQLIDSLSTDFDPSKYKDEYREAVLEMIERKAEGQEIAVAGGARGARGGAGPDGRARGSRSPQRQAPVRSRKAKIEVGRQVEVQRQVEVEAQAEAKAKRRGQEVGGGAGRRGRRRGPAPAPLQPRQGPLPRGGLHQGPGDRLLHARRPGGCCRTCAAGRSRSSATPTGWTRSHFYEKQKPSHAPEWVQLGADPGRRPRRSTSCSATTCRRWCGWPTSPTSSCTRRWRWPRTPTRPTVLAFDLDPGPAGGAGRVLRGGAAAARDAGPARSRLLRQDVGLEGHAGLRAAQHRHRLRRHQAVRARPRPAARAAAPEADRVGDEEGAAAREGLHRLEPERPAQDDGGRLLPARARAPDGVHAARRGTRSRAGDARPRWCSRPATCSSGWRSRGDLFAPRAGDRAGAARTSSFRRMVDWGLARQIARFAARSDDEPDLGLDLAALAREIERPVVAHTGLDAGEPRARRGGRRPRGVGRGQPRPRSRRCSTRSRSAWRRRFDAAGPFAGALRAGAGVTLAAEVGLVTGYMSQRVLGQYELSLLAPSPAPRLLFVAPNLDRAAAELGVDRESFLRWVTIHELVHALQFGGVPWLRGHLGGPAARVPRHGRRADRQRAPRAACPRCPTPASLVERFREGGLAALVQTREQREHHGPGAGRDGGGRGPRRARDGRAGARAGARPRGPARGDGRAAADAAPPPSGS